MGSRMIHPATTSSWVPTSAAAIHPAAAAAATTAGRIGRGATTGTPPAGSVAPPSDSGTGTATRPSGSSTRASVADCVAARSSRAPAP